MDTLKSQVDKLRWRVALHEERLKVLQHNTTLLKSQLDTINKSLLQIKWFVVGGLLVWAGDRMGILELLKLVT